MYSCASITGKFMDNAIRGKKRILKGRKYVHRSKLLLSDHLISPLLMSYNLLLNYENKLQS
jgi:hypothetical protein